MDKVCPTCRQREEKRACPDGGYCHHRCGAGGCFRVLACGPLSGVYPGNEWPELVVTREREAESLMPPDPPPSRSSSVQTSDAACNCRSAGECAHYTEQQWAEMRADLRARASEARETVDREELRTIIGRVEGSSVGEAVRRHYDIADAILERLRAGAVKASTT